MWYNVNICKRFKVFDTSPNAVFSGEVLSEIKTFNNPQFFYSYKKLNAVSSKWDSSLSLVSVGGSWKIATHSTIKSDSVITVFCYEGD